MINFNQDAPNNVGNFTSANGYEDLPIPGIPGWGDSTDGMAGEFLTYAYLKREHTRSVLIQMMAFLEPDRTL